ncbi:hypothetical protein [Acrocarpospora sp. B8E8]
MPTDLLIEGADAYTSLTEIAASDADALELLADTTWIWSLCTLTIEGGC